MTEYISKEHLKLVFKVLDCVEYEEGEGINIDFNTIIDAIPCIKLNDNGDVESKAVEELTVRIDAISELFFDLQEEFHCYKKRHKNEK
jgi:hypothetical protein